MTTAARVAPAGPASVPSRAVAHGVRRARVKFCGMTRPEDAARAASLGATHVGCIFAGGPRLVDAARARAIGEAATGARLVGVMGTQPADVIAALAREGRLDVVQLHADPTRADVAAVRHAWDGEVWAVLRVAGSVLPAHAAELFAVADAVVLDAKVEGTQLGGTGVTLAWTEFAGAVHAVRGQTPVVLAGGLRPENVATAVRALAPDLVDVSSGVEAAPGVKDHARMAAFTAAVAGALAGAGDAARIA